MTRFGDSLRKLRKQMHAGGRQLRCVAVHSIAHLSTKVERANLKVERILCSRLSGCAQQDTPLTEGGVVEGSHTAPCFVPCMPTTHSLQVTHNSFTYIRDKDESNSVWLCSQTQILNKSWFFVTLYASRIQSPHHSTLVDCISRLIKIAC